MDRRWMGVLLATGAAAGLAVAQWAAADEPGEINPPVDATESPAAPQVLPTTVVMHAKLTSTQQVLAGLLAEDYEAMGAAAAELRGLARDVPPRDTGDPARDLVYGHFRYELIRLAAELEQMAASENLSGAAYVHGHVTAACIGCHQHLREPDSGVERMLHLTPTP